jgi:polyhydroxyalkanoate synthesis regulator phasin
MKPTDLLHIGLGAAYMAKERVEAQLKDLEQLGAISKDEMNRFVQEAQERAQKEKEALDARIKEKVFEAAKELGLATKEDIAEIKALLLRRDA